MAKKALIVDDDPTIRNLVQSILEDAGYQVSAAEDGQQGIDILTADTTPSTYTIVILDVVMPGLNGIDVLTRMKLSPRFQTIPVIMLTGESKPEDVLTGYNVGADYYITKPFTRQQLLFGLQIVLSEEK